MLGVAVEMSKSSLLSSSLTCVRQMVLRVGFKFRLANARVRVPRPSRLLMALLAGYGVQAMALPAGGQVASGSVTIAAPSGTALDITQTSTKGIINWQSFNVGSGEKVNFLQPSATSSTLNRVVGSDPSRIFGQINANGQVFLINNSGILFGRGAQVNASGLVASTLQLADSDYLAGHFTLSGAGGSVTNEGVLKAGFVALAGAQVSNTGTIVADGGTAALAAGDRVTLNLVGSDLVSVSVDAPTAAALVHAGGIVQADGGQVLISAKAADALLGTVVNVDGIVQAHAIGSRNGVVTLDGGSSGVVAVSGTLDASGKGAGQTGGTVKVTGADVGLFGHATIDASGNAGGGVVRVGGDWHGAGADGDANASQVFAGGHSTIDASAIASGRGGDVVVWSNDHTVAVGKISVRGGASSGDGGAVETSSAKTLQVAGAVDASAAHGRAGKWLIDPEEITITGATDSHINGDGVIVPFVNSQTSSTLSTTTLNSALTGADVTVQTAGTGDGVIKVAGAIASTGNANSSLTLDATTAIHFVGGTIAPGGTGKLAVTLLAGSGGVSMDSGSSITTGPGGSLDVTSGGAVSLGTLTVGNATTGANLTISAAGAVTQTGGWDVSNGTTTVTTTNGDITLTGANNFKTLAAHDADAAGNVLVSTSGALVLAGIDDDAGGTLGGNLIVSAGGSVTQSAALKVHGSTAVGTTAGDVTLTGANTIGTFSAHDSDAAGNVAITTGGALSLGAINNGSGGTLAGNLTVVAGGAVTQSAAAKVAGTTTVTTAGNVTLTAANTIDTFAAHASGASAAVSIATDGALVLAGVDNGSGAALGNNLIVSAGGSVTQSAALKVGGNTAVGTTSGDITLTGANTIGAFSAHDSDAAGNISITTGGALALGAINNGSGGTLAGDLTVIAGGAVTQGAALKVAGTTTVTTTSGDITLTSGNTIGTFAAHDADAAGTVSITTGGALALAGIDNNAGGSLAGDLNVIAGGAVTQSAAAKVAGTTTVTTAGNVTLTAANTIGTFAAHASGASAAVSIATGGALALAGVDNGSGGSLGGNLIVSAGGAVTQSAALKVGGSTAVGTTAGDITLAGSNTIGTFSAHDADAAGNISIATGGALSLGAINNGSGGTLAGNLTVSAGGAVTQSAAAKVAGTTTVTAGGNVTLTSANTIGTFVAHDSGAGANVSVTTGGALVLAGVDNGSGAALGGNLTVNAGGAVTQSAALRVAGTADVTTTTGDITLTGSNSIAGFGAHDAGAGANVSITTGGALVLSGVDNNAGGAIGGILTVSAGGTVSQAGSTAVKVGGTTSATTTSGNISLGNSGNTFAGAVAATGSSINIAATGNLNVTPTLGGGGSLSLAANGGGTLTIPAGTISTTGDVSLTAGGGLTTNGDISAHNVLLGGGALSIGNHIVATGTFGATSTSTISETGSGDIVATGLATLSAPGNTITLLAATNAFQGGANFTGSDVTLVNAGALAIGGTATGNLSLTSTGGAITQASVLHVTGTSALDAGSNAITLATSTNDFGGAVTVTGGAVSLADANTLTLGGTSTGNLSVAANGVAFGATTVGGNLTVAGGSGTITQNGALAVTGTSTLGAGANAITLANAANDFGGAVTVNSTGAVSLADANTLTVVGNMTGLVTVSAATADVEQAGALKVHLANVGTGIVKSNAAATVDGSSTGDVTVSGTTVAFGGGATTVGGKLAATSSAGDITQAGTLGVTGTSTLAAGSGNVTLANAGNALAGAVTASGANVTLADASPLTAHLAANGSATLTSAGALSVDGSAAALTATGASITQGATLTVTGLSQFDAGSGDILLDSPGTNLQGAVTAKGHTIHLTDTHAIDATLTSTGDVVLSSASDIQAKGTFGGGLKATGAKVSLDQGTLAQPLAVAGLLDVTSTGDTSLAYVTTKGAQVTAGGTLLLGGTLASSGNVTLKGLAIQGVNKLGALDVAAGSTATLTATSGNIGKTTPAPGVIDDLAIIQLAGVTGQSGLSVSFNSGQSAWFRVPSQTQTGKLVVNQSDVLRSQTFFCDLVTCVNLLGQTTSIADSVIANILSAASQDAADAAFGTENLDFAIRKGYVTTIGRVPPGIDEIAGDLGATQCDSRVTSPTAIAAEKSCSAGK